VIANSRSRLPPNALRREAASNSQAVGQAGALSYIEIKSAKCHGKSNFTAERIYAEVII